MLQVKSLHLLTILFCIVSYFFSKTLVSLVLQKDAVVIILIGDLQILWVYFALLKANHDI